jgi:hypothetical protein
MTLEATEAECAVGRTAPRVSLASMEAKITAKHFVNGADALPPGHPVPPSMALLTLCFLVMENGFVLIGKSAPASAANYDKALGERLAYEDAIRQLWPMEGYALRDRLATIAS